MAGVSDKARFYLEQSVPELVELERKNLFSKVRLTTSLKTPFYRNGLSYPMTRPPSDIFLTILHSPNSPP